MRWERYITSEKETQSASRQKEKNMAVQNFYIPKYIKYMHFLMQYTEAYQVMHILHIPSIYQVYAVYALLDILGYVLYTLDHIPLPVEHL